MKMIDKIMNLRNVVKIGVTCLAVVVMFSCKKPDNNGLNGFKCSVQVNNQASATKAIAEDDEVELYVKTFAYVHQTSPKWMIIVASSENGMRDEDENLIVNDGWFNAKTTEWLNQASRTSGLYPAIMLDITKLKVNGKEYSFRNPGIVLFGDLNDPNVGQPRSYIDNFKGINMTDSATSLNTILTIYPDIIGTPDAGIR